MKKILFTFLFLVAFMAGYTQMANNGGTITVETGAVLVIEGDYTSTGAGIIKIDGNVQLKGNFINNSGTIDPASLGTLTFNGIGAQQIGGTASTTFNCAVVVNNSNGVSLNGANAVLAKALTLTNGKLTLNAYDLTMALVGITVTPGNWVVTNNAAGELKGVVGNSNVTFPVGSTTSYNPVILNNTGGTSDTYGVVYTAALPAGFTPTNHAVTGNWAVSEANPLNSNLTVTPQWNATEELVPFDRTDCAVGVSDGTSVTWAAGGAAVANGSAWTRSGSPFATLGKFVVGDYFYEGIDLDLDVFLAGPYSAGSMSTALYTLTLIPTTDPYGNIATATPIPNSSVVDWIEVELRDQTTPATVVKSYSFFLDNNGNVLNTKGNVGAKLTGVLKSNYYVAVRHRNHLGARTASTINFAAAGPFAFDFSAGTGINGTNPMRNMGADWALWAGDTDSDGDVEFTTGNSDITPISAAVLSGGNTDPTIATAPIYSPADADMNGTVQFTTGTSDITPVSASVLNNPANTANDPTLVLTQQLP